MATSRATGYVPTATVWNNLFTSINDAGTIWSGAVDGSTGAFSSTLAVTGASTLTGNVSMGGTLALTAAGGTIKERARSTALGEWIAVSYSAGDFTSNTNKWDVASGDVALNRYTLIGKTLIWSLGISASSVTDASETELRATIPGGFTSAARSYVSVAYMSDNSTLRDDAYASASTSTYVSISRTSGAAWASSTNATSVYFQIAIEIV